MVSLNLFFFTICSLFFIGACGLVFNRNSILLVILCIEIILLSINLLLVCYSSFFDDIFGEVFAIYVLTVAAAESALGLAILVAFYKLKGNIFGNSVNLMQGLVFRAYSSVVEHLIDSQKVDSSTLSVPSSFFK